MAATATSQQATGRTERQAPASAAAPALVALLAVSALMVGTGVEILPAGGVVSVFTLGRLLILAGLVALVAGGARLPDFRTYLDIPIVVLVAASVITTYRGGHEVAPLRFLVTVAALYYLTVGLWRRYGEAREALPLVALVTVVASAVVGVAQVAQDEPTSFYRDGFDPVVSPVPRDDLLGRAIGSFDNPNLLATHVLLMAPFGVLAAVRAPTRSLRAVGLGLVALAYVGLVLTFSRAGIGAALLALAAVSYARFPPWRERIRALAALGAVAVALGAAVTGGGLIGGFGRPEAWSMATEIAVTEKPLTGIGLARAGDVMNALGDEEIRFRHAHNLWLTWWVEAGPFALLAMIWITVWLVGRSFADAARGGEVATAGLAAMVGFFAFSMLDHPANVERIATAFWLVAALVSAGAMPARRRGGAPGTIADGRTRVEGLLARARELVASRRGEGRPRRRRAPRPAAERTTPPRTPRRPGPPRGPGSRRSPLVAGAIALLAIAGCGSDDREERKTARAPSTGSAPAPAPNRGARDAGSPAAPAGAPERGDDPVAAGTARNRALHDGGARAGAEPAGGGGEPVRAEAVVTGRGGRLTPPLIQVPPYIAVLLVLRSGDGRPYAVELGRRRLDVNGGKTASASLPALAPGKRYTARPGNGGRPVLIEASAEPGP